MVKYYPRRRRRSTAITIGKPNTNSGVKKTIAKTQVKLYKKKATTATKALVNRMAIMTLSKQVNQLQKSKLGDFQQCFEKFGFQPDGTTVSDLYPVCFCVNDFNNSYTTDVGAPVWRTLNDSAIKLGNFSLVTTPVAQGITDYHFKSENNTASKVIYAPISSTITVEAKDNMAAATTPIVIRVDIVKQKKILNNSKHFLQLPYTMRGLGRMAYDNAAERNKFNKEYITVLQTKYIWLEQKDSDNPKAIRKSVNFHLRFDPKKPIRTDSEADGALNSELDFYNQVDPKDQIYCLLNFSTTSGFPIDINIFRTNRWYDQHGTD